MSIISDDEIPLSVLRVADDVQDGNQQVDLLRNKLKMKCIKCGRKWKTYSDYANHECGRTYHCHFCRSTFYYLKTLRRHIMDHLKKITYEKKFKIRKFTCDHCKKIFSSLSALQIHILSVHYGIEYRCNKCCNFYVSAKNLERHKCKGELICQDCGKIFYRKYLLKKHCLSHSNSSLRCKFCYSTFVRQTFYDNHIAKLNCSKAARNHWLENYSYQKCHLCQDSFTSGTDYVDHFKLFHTGSPFACFWCAVKISSMEELKQHVHQHNVERYTCRQCNKAYTSQEGYRKHKIKHMTSRLQCEICGKEYLSRRRAELHQANCFENKNKRKKMARQLNWESQIIVKKIRGVDVDESVIDNNSQSKPEEDSLSDRQGWFDEYYNIGNDDDVAPPAEDLVSDADHEVLPVQNSSESEDSSDCSGDEINQDFDFDPKLCRICNQQFSLEYELLHHFVKNHPCEIPHECPYCKEKAPLFAQLKEHLKVHGIGMGVFHCGYCSKSFRSEARGRKHRAKCRGDVEEWPSVKVCRGCGKSFQTKCGYKKHRRSACKREKKTKTSEPKPQTQLNPEPAEEDLHYSDNDSWQVDDPVVENQTLPVVPPEEDVKDVEICEENSKENIISAPKVVTNNFTCRLCNALFPSERGIVMHFKAHHPGEKPLICPHCGVALADKLKEHLKTHGIGEEFVCELCNKRFNQKFMSKIHELWHQGIEHKCANCSQKFLSAEKMNRHVEAGKCLGRASLMLLPCDICGRRYRSRYNLKSHYLTHTPRELRPVKKKMNCEFCGKWFENNNALQRHRRIHTGEKPFCCRFCPKAFAQEGNCKAHERLHTGEVKKKRKAVQSFEMVPYETAGIVGETVPQLGL